MQIQQLYTAFIASTGVTTDSRHCPSGSIFFALKGASFNGNLYAGKALELGCSYAVIDEKEFLVDDRCFLVDDVLTALQELANYHRKQLQTPIIGITGSNGKTTTKELLAVALSSKFNLHFTQGNFNNHIGVPLTLLQLKKEHELAIVEMGANHPNEIAELCEIAEPDMGIITNIGKAHLEGFGGLDGVIKTKKELYDFIRKIGGTVFVNGGDQLLVSLSEGIRRIPYNDVQSKYDVSVKEALPSLTLAVAHHGENDIISTQLVGDYNRLNVAVVLELGDHLGLDFASMKACLEAYQPSNNRSQIVKTDKNTVILDAYNANPASMAVAVENFSSLDMPNKVVILGAMKELGVYSKDEHQALVNTVCAADFQLSIFVGEEFDGASALEGQMFFASVQDVRTYFETTPLQSSTILLKGSRSMKMETLVDIL